MAKSISDVSWYELTRQLEYKAKWNGRKYIKINTFYASSQLCSACGYQNTETKNLSVREWTCPVCGTNHDRDINAAKNVFILIYFLPFHFALYSNCLVSSYQNTEKKNLTVREWICPVCGTNHDRDINAAKNILEEGLRQIA